MDAASDRYLADMHDRVFEAIGSDLGGVYLHGSAVLGGYDPCRSDIDVLVVSRGPLAPDQQATLARDLSEAALPCPARGLELSVLTRHVALHPSARPPFELHLTTHSDDRKVVDGHDRPGDPDLVLHFAICRAAGRLIGSGLPPQAAFAAVPDGLVLHQLSRELAWASEHAPHQYAVLNACRAWKFAADGTLVSKLDGGTWALGIVHDESTRVLIDVALGRQRGTNSSFLDAAAVQRFAQQVRAEVLCPRADCETG